MMVVYVGLVWGDAMGGCLYNATHCACSEKSKAGTCLRKESETGGESVCVVGECSLEGYKCDCDGLSVCLISGCSSWVAKDGRVGSALVEGSRVACVEKRGVECLSKVEVEREFRMVRFGGVESRELFNMSFLPDEGDFIAGEYGMHDKWDHHETLKYRHVTLRLYKSSGGEAFLCGVYNTYGLPNDGLGTMKVKVEVSSVGGGEMKWLACDDKRECGAVGDGNSTLRASHRLLFTHSDGWCVTPVEDEGGVVVRFSDMQGFEGITFQLAEEGEGSYYFADEWHRQSFGLEGEVDANGLVSDGRVPEIMFNLAQGIPVPQ